MAIQRADDIIEKEIFTTMQTLEAKNIVTREDDLKKELKVELEREQRLQENYQIVKAHLAALQAETSN